MTDATDVAELDADADDEVEPAGDAADGAAAPGDVDAVAAAPSSRWARLGGALASLYIVWYIADLALYSRSPTGFNAAHRFYDRAPMRVLFAVVLLGILFHGCNGLRVAAVDLHPPLARHDAWWRAAARFVTFAAWIPLALMLWWPVIQGWILG